MKKTRIFLAAVLCLSLLTFAGCGGNNDAGADGGTDSTVTENANDGNGTDNSNGADNGTGNGSGSDNGSSTNNGDSLTEDMADGARDMVDDTEKAVDDLTNDARDAADSQGSRTKE